MGVLVCELDEFIFDGGAIAGANAFDLATVERGEMEVLLNDFSRSAGGLGHPAGDLICAWGPTWQPLLRVFHVEQVGLLPGVMEGEKGRGGVARLGLALGKVDGGSEDTRRRPRLESLEFDSCF